MNLCATCKFWGTDEDYGKRFRGCTLIVHDEDFDADVDLRSPHHQSRRTEIVKRITDFQDTHLAVTQDAEQYKSGLLCREDFGCVLHKEKS
jgi:hypothetical protein